MSTGNGEVVSVKITLNEKNDPPGKLADAEVIFKAGAGPLEGLRLLGFGVWDRHNDAGKHVTLPSRPYSDNGMRRNFVLLRPANNELSALDALKECILDAYNRVEVPKP